MTDTLILPLTDRTRVALAIARGIAAARGDDDLSATHVVLGMIREGENPMVVVLYHAGIPARALRHELEVTLGHPGHPRAGEVAIPSTPGEERLLEQAIAEAQRRGNEFLAPEHLLLAILREGRTPAAQVLASHGLRVETTEKHLECVFDPHAGPLESRPAT